MERRPAKTQDELRRHNLSTLLRMVHRRGTLSRAELTGLTGLNRSTVKALCYELQLAGLLREGSAVGTGAAGRPSISVEPEHERTFVLALDVGVEHLTAVRVGLGGRVLDRRGLRQRSGDYAVRPTVNRLTRLAHTLLDGAPEDALCVGVGLGICGIASDLDGIVHFAPNLGWSDVPLRALVAKGLHTELPIRMGNDADLGALAESVRGSAVGIRNLVYISGEVGIGGGVVIDGSPLSGTGGFGGEIGHMLIGRGGRQCRCGRVGCWETEIGEDAVLQSTKAPADCTLGDVLAAHLAGEIWPRAGLRRVGRALGEGVVNLVNIFNPEAILFGGLSEDIFVATEPEVRRVLESALPASRAQVRLLRPALGDDAIAIGAAELAFAPLLDDPLGWLSAMASIPRAERAQPQRA